MDKKKVDYHMSIVENQSEIKNHIIKNVTFIKFFN